MAARSLLIDLTPVRESRDFRRLWLSQLATGAGRQVVIVALPYQVYVLTHSSLLVGLLGVVQAVPIVVAGLYGGALADRFDRRRLQLAAKTAVAAGSLALALGAVGLRAPVGFVYAVVTITAAASTVDQASRTATVARLVPPGLLPSAMSLSQALFQGSAIVGPALAGLIIARAGLSWAYLADVLAFAPAALMVWRLSPQRPSGVHQVPIGWRAPLEAIRYVRRSRLVVGLFSADLVAMIFGMPTALFPALALSVFGIGAGGLGLLYAALAAGGLAGSLLSGWVRSIVRQGRAVFVAIAIWGLAITGFGLAGSRLWLSLPLLAVAGAGDLVSAIFRGTILQVVVPDSMRGRMSAFHLMVVTTGPRLGDLEAGAVAALAGPIFSVVSGGIACVAGIAVLAALLPQMRRHRSAAAAPDRVRGLGSPTALSG
ncbi:MAG TPA: MFS transporter [Candidatus Dormibacteraeota bacterium]|nr:MFS transporter [Candidatus Dormibacteraeota bacterium]